MIMPVNGTHAYILHTTNRLLGRIPGVEGIKTGFTSKAGRCLIAKVSQNGSDLLVVILNSNRRWNTATSLFSYGFRASGTPSSAFAPDLHHMACYGGWKRHRLFENRPS